MLVRELSMACRSDCGRVRTNNEVSVLVNARSGFAILADGMGGYRAGEVASGMATALLNERLQALPETIALDSTEVLLDIDSLQERLEHEIRSVNNAIFAASLTEACLQGMGTTLVLGLFIGEHLLVAHIGDSRLYRLRQGQLTCLTHDHSMIQFYLDRGWLTDDEAEISSCRGMLTRALGVAPWVEIDFSAHAIAGGDVYLLCSDGLTGMLEDEMIKDALQTFGESPDSATNVLIQMANDCGGEDNISVAVIHVGRA